MVSYHLYFNFPNIAILGFTDNFIDVYLTYFIYSCGAVGLPMCGPVHGQQVLLPIVAMQNVIAGKNIILCPLLLFQLEPLVPSISSVSVPRVLFHFA